MWLKGLMESIGQAPLVMLTKAMTPCHGIYGFSVYSFESSKSLEDPGNGVEGPLKVAALSWELDLAKHF